MDLVMSPWEAGERVEYIQELVDEGDLDNRPAIRGLALPLSLLPHHPRTVRVLGALVERLPVKTTVVSSGVRALARLTDGAGRPELERLADCVTHKAALKQIRAALAV